MSPRLRSKTSPFKTQVKDFFWQHWLDLIVIGIIITVLASLLWTRSQRQTDWVMVQIKVSHEEWWWQANSPDYWYAQNLEPGVQGQNSFGETVAEVVKSELTDVGAARNQVIVWAKLKASYDPRKDQYIFGFQPLQIGRGLELSFGPQQVKGLVVSIAQEPPQVVEKIVEIKVYEVDLKAAEAIKLNMENKNSVGDVLAKIVTLNIEKTERSEFSDIRGRMIQVSDPNFAQIQASVKMRLVQDGDRYITPDGQPVKIGSKLTLQFPQTVLTQALVADIKPVLPQ